MTIDQQKSEAPQKTIFLDECGYTGDDLFDSAQPVFTIATHDIGEIEATELKKLFFSRIKADELKHQALQRKTRTREAVLEFMRWLVKNPARTRTVIGHKKFALTAKLADFVMEPGLHRAGIDLRERGGLAALSNMLFYSLQAEGSSVLDAILVRFQKAIRTRRDEDWADFFELLHQDHGPSLDEVVRMIRGSTYTLKRDDISTLPEHPLDLSLTLALNCVYRWRNMGHTRIAVVHDQSSNMARQSHLWGAILGPTAPPATVGNVSFTVPFPIGVEATDFASSRSSNSLQLADAIAGAVYRWARWIVNGSAYDDAYGRQLHEILVEAPVGTFSPDIWPTGNVGLGDEQPDGVVDSFQYLIERAGDALG